MSINISNYINTIAWQKTTNKITLTYVDDEVGIGVATPSGKLSLAGSTTSSNSSPLKINSGSLMTTPETGAIEYDGSNLYVTGSSRFSLTSIVSYSGYSGYSGQSVSGYSGKSGYSGQTGFVGISGYSGKSGYSGLSGIIINLS